MKMADEGYGNSVREKLSIGENVRTFWYRTDENGAYTEITVNENFENFTAAIEQDNDYLELTDVDPDPQESYLAYWVVRPGDDPVATMQIPGAITSSEEEARLFEGWFLEDGTRLEDSPYYMGPGVDHVGNLDRDVTFYGHWRTAESDEGSPDGGDGFGTLLAVGAVVGVAGVVAYQVGTELILDQLLPAGVAVPHTRAELAMLLWNTAGRPAPAALPAFADVADPEMAQAAQWAIEQGYLKARADGSFKLMIVAENGDGNNIVQGRLSIGNDVSRFWYRTDENGAYTEINVKENYENFTAAIGQNQDYLELTDVDPDPQESYLAYWVVRPGDDPVATMQIPGAITSSEEEARLFEGWFLEDGTRLEDSPYYMGPGVDHVGNLDRDVTFYGHWRTAESDEGSPDGGDGFGTLLAVGAVVGVAGVVAYQVGTELILDQLLPAGVAVPHTRAELAMLLWNTAGRPAPAALPAFADVADPEMAQAAQWAIEQGYLKARADGSFKPDKGVAKWRVIRGYRAVTEP